MSGFRSVQPQEEPASRWFYRGIGYCMGLLRPQAPSHRIAHELLVHGVEQRLERVAVGEVAKPAAARLADPAGGGGLAVIRPVPQQEVNTSLVIRGRVLFIGDKESVDTAGDRMGLFDDVDLEPLERAVADVPASHQVEIRTIGGVQSHRIVQVEEAPASLNKRDNGTLLLGLHPDEVRASVSLGAHQAIAQDDQELDLRQVLCRQGIHVHREVGDHTCGVEDRLQPLLDMTGLVGLVADQDERMRA